MSKQMLGIKTKEEAYQLLCLLSESVYNQYGEKVNYSSDFKESCLISDYDIIFNVNYKEILITKSDSRYKLVTTFKGKKSIFYKRLVIKDDKLTELAKEIREFLKKNDLYSDVRIYFNGIAFGDSEEEIQDIDPIDYFSYATGVLSMSFEGPLYSVFNYPSWDEVVLQQKFEEILRKYGYFHELGHAWNLSIYPL